MINPMDLSGKRYLVTGASQGLGRQVSITLSQLGAEVILVARNEEKLRETLEMLEDGNHAYFSFDLGEVDKIEGLIKCMMESMGSLDGIVHSAGLGITKPLSFTTYSFMQDMMNVNVLSFVEMVRIVSKKKYINNGGSIVAVSSAASVRGAKAKCAYCSTKGALDSAVQSLAVELGTSKRIRVNAVNPGWIKTDMYHEYIGNAGEEKIAEIEGKQFLGVAEPEDVANVIAFLLSDASAQITGQAIMVDGGSTVW